MLSTFKAAQYVDVFAPKTGVDNGLVTFCIVLIGVGFFTILLASVIGEDFAVLGVGFGIALVLGGSIGVGEQVKNSDTARQEILKGMVSNVKEKYHADLDTTNLDSKFYSDLDKVKTYVLAFENGASGEYSMKFMKSGEPVVVEGNEAPIAPSVKKLNDEAGQDANNTTSTPTQSASPAPPNR